MKKKFLYNESTILTNDGLPNWKDLQDENYKVIYEEFYETFNEVTFFI